MPQYSAVLIQRCRHGDKSSGVMLAGNNRVSPHQHGCNGRCGLPWIRRFGLRGFVPDGPTRGFCIFFPSLLWTETLAVTSWTQDSALQRLLSNRRRATTIETHGGVRPCFGGKRVLSDGWTAGGGPPEEDTTQQGGRADEKEAKDVGFAGVGTRGSHRGSRHCHCWLSGSARHWPMVVCVQGNVGGF